MRLSRWIIIGGSCLIAVAGTVSVFGYGILVGRFQLAPYDWIRENVWQAGAIQAVVAPSLESSLQSEGTVKIETNLLYLGSKTVNESNPFGLTGGGGAIKSVRGRVFGVDRIGIFFEYSPSSAEAPASLRVLDLNFPETNRAQFIAEMRRIVSDAEFQWEFDRYFRVLDFEIREVNTEFEVYVSYFHWDTQRKGKALRIARMRVASLDALGGERDWQVIYESSPRVEFGEYPHTSMKSNHTGGRMVISKNGKLLLGTGDQQLDGVLYPLSASQDGTVAYGKIIEIDLESIEARIFAKGIRNPQGLLIDTEGRIWETEHGPRGGDELNLIEQGENYGWPDVSYGTGRMVWLPKPGEGRHVGFRAPVYAWVPSIGISNLIQIGSQPLQWSGDFLVSSLKGVTLFRLRVIEGRVVVSEPIQIGQRVRDLQQLDDGRILILADDARFVEISILGTQIKIASLTAEEQRFGLRERLKACQVCHSFTAQAPIGYAPSLAGVYGRRLGAHIRYRLAGFGEVSVKFS